MKLVNPDACLSDCTRLSQEARCLNCRYLLCCYGGRPIESSRGVPKALKFYSGKLATGKQCECKWDTRIRDVYRTGVGDYSIAKSVTKSCMSKTLLLRVLTLKWKVVAARLYRSALSIDWKSITSGWFRKKNNSRGRIGKWKTEQPGRSCKSSKLQR